jgi:diguanylate cyclase (GGDEF)-like protein
MTSDREDAAERRDTAAEGRDTAAERRDTAAERRDTAAERRDTAAERRDAVAAERDSAALRRDTAAQACIGTKDTLRSGREHATSDRGWAARDRADGLRDRQGSAHDRTQSADDRAQAGVDALTGALGRGRGLVELQREIDRASRSDQGLVLAFIDVDGLKVINDEHGHAAGDEMLRDIAAALIGGLRSYDLVIRYGGDEFLCAFSGTDIEGARRRCDEVRRALADRTPNASVSVGLAAHEKSETLNELTARADAALYAGRRRSL